jgi:serine/threonine-protein kinase
MADPWRVAGYAEVRELGRGAGGTVVQATDDHSGETVAIKYLAAELPADDGFRRALRSEALVLAEIDSPQIVRVLDYIECLRHTAVVREFVPGGSVLGTLVAHGPTDPKAALAILKSSLHGLVAAHRAGLAHHDLKPKNVLITLTGDCKLVDFGIGPRAHGVVGTLAYRPPGYWSTGLAGPRGDIYAATAIFVECLTMRPPVADNDRTALLPGPLQDLARSGLSMDPAVHPPDAAAFLTRLERAAERAYGRDWEEPGRRDLARRAAPLAERSSRHLAAASIGTSTPPEASRGSTAELLGAAALLVVAIGIATAAPMPGVPDRGALPGAGRPPVAAPPSHPPREVAPPGGVGPPWTIVPGELGAPRELGVLPVVLAAPIETTVVLDRRGAPLSRRVTPAPVVLIAPIAPAATLARAAPAPLLGVRSSRSGLAVEATPAAVLSVPPVVPPVRVSLPTGSGSLELRAEVGPGVAVRVGPKPAPAVRKAPAARGSQRTGSEVGAKNGGGAISGIVRALSGRRGGGSDDSDRQRQSGDSKRQSGDNKRQSSDNKHGGDNDHHGGLLGRVLGSSRGGK